MSDFLLHAASFPTVVFSVLVLLSLLYWGFVILSGLELDSSLEGSVAGSAETLEPGFASAWLGWIGVGRVPVGVVLTVWSLSGWILCYVSTRWIIPEASGGIGLASLLGLGALIVSVPVTHLASARLGPLFASAPAEAREDLVGRSCRIDTGSVDLRFGQASLLEDGDWRVVQVRCSETGALKRGDEALIIAWDDALDAFRVEPLKHGEHRKPET